MRNFTNKYLYSIQYIDWLFDEIFNSDVALSVIDKRLLLQIDRLKELSSGLAEGNLKIYDVRKCDNDN